MFRLTWQIFGALLVCVGSVLAQGDISEPPSSIPPSCSTVSFVSLLTENGTDSFRLLHFEIRALQLAHKANTTMAHSVSPSGKDTPTLALAGMLVSMSEVVDGFSCAAYLMGRVPTEVSDAAEVKSSSITAYNVLARVSDAMKTRAVRKFSGAGGESLSAVEDAQELAKIIEGHKNAASLLFDSMVATLIAARTAGSNPNNADTWQFTCAERKVILAEVGLPKSARAPGDDFERILGFVRSTVTERSKCS